MDLGPRDGHLSIPMPFPSHYPSIPDSARMQIFAGGNGVPAEEMRPPEVKPPKEVVRYRDCRRNHAANIGGHVLDGCCEFMPSGEHGSADALKCAACGCHRNFHRREVEGEICCDCHQTRRDRKRTVPYGALNQSPLSVLPSRDGVPPHNPQMVMALNSTPTDSDDPDAPHARLGSSMRKRFRTKFSAEQKEKMRLFAERLCWKIQKQDEPEVQQFCNDISVKRNVLKVWMHNNKNAVGKKMENGSDLLKTRDCSPDLS